VVSFLGGKIFLNFDMEKYDFSLYKKTFHGKMAQIRHIFKDLKKKNCLQFNVHLGLESPLDEM
jgi:hypothetical protein